ncbi:MAG: phage integrase SAM-like domain-containing protein, partial [Mycobacteriales bacterium]
MRIRRDAAVVRTSEPSVLFGDYAASWIDHQVELARAGLIRANTITRFESALAAHLVPFFASYPLSDIPRERCDAFRAVLYQSDHLAPRTINALMEVLRLVLRRAIQDGVMHRPDPMLGIRPLWTTPRRVDCYSPAEARRLLDATPAPHRAVVALAVLAVLA